MKYIYIFSLAIDKQTTPQNNNIQAGNQSMDLKTKGQSAVTHSAANKNQVNLGTWVTIVLIGVLAASLIYFFRAGRKAI